MSGGRGILSVDGGDQPFHKAWCDRLIDPGKPLLVELSAILLDQALDDGGVDAQSGDERLEKMLRDLAGQFEIANLVSALARVFASSELSKLTGLEYLLQGELARSGERDA